MTIFDAFFDGFTSFSNAYHFNCALSSSSPPSTALTKPSSTRGRLTDGQWGRMSRLALLNTFFFTMTDRQSNRATRSARARRPVRREGQPVLPALQGALPLPAVPVPRTATSAPSSAVSAVASLLRPADAAPPLEQRLDSQLSIQAMEFQP